MKCKSFLAVIALVCLGVHARAADTYTIDPMHSFVTFSVPHLMISHVEGKFDKFTGTLTLDDGALAAASGTIQAGSIDTGVPPRDKHLKSAAFFDVEKYPTISFQSKRVEKQGDQLTVAGDFTMHGVTKEVSLTGKLNGPVKDQMGKTRIGLELKTTLNRKDFGLTYNQLLESGGAMVGNEIEIGIEAEAIKAATP